MKFVIYKIQNKVSGKFYVGRTKNEKRRYSQHLSKLRNGTHHCRYLQNAWKSYGEEKFEYLIVERYANEEECAGREQYYLDNFKDQIYNKSESAYGGGDNISNHPERERIVKNISLGIQKMYANMTPEERKATHGLPGKKNGMYGKTHTVVAREKMSEKIKQFYMENESYRTGKTIEELHGEEKAKEIRQELSKIASERTGEKNPFYGKNHTEEARKKMAEYRTGKKPVNQRPVIIDGVEYPSATEASRVLKVVPATILHRIKSKNEKYKGYFYKEKSNA